MKSKYRAAIVSGFAWGFLEGIFFFLVPDPLLCFWALKSWRHMVAATIGVVLGTIMSAWLVFVILRSNAMMYLHFQSFWAALPGFRPQMLELAAVYFDAEGAKGILLGTSTGIPFRAYILEAWKQGVHFSDLLLWIPLARLERILIAPIATLVLRRGMHWLWVDRFKKMDENLLRVALILSVISYWVAMYVWYWAIFLPSTYS